MKIRQKYKSRKHGFRLVTRRVELAFITWFEAACWRHSCKLEEYSVSGSSVATATESAQMMCKRKWAFEITCIGPRIYSKDILGPLPHIITCGRSWLVCLALPCLSTSLPSCWDMYTRFGVGCLWWFNYLGLLLHTEWRVYCAIAQWFEVCLVLCWFEPLPAELPW